MAKINIIKPTGNESLILLSAFKVEDTTYAIFDSEKVGSMGLPIIYVTKLTDKLEQISDNNEWQSVKNYLKGIISGTNFKYVKINDSLNADEAFYTPLTLPQSSFDLIKSRYVIPEDDNSGVEQLSMEEPAQPPINNSGEVNSLSNDNIESKEVKEPTFNNQVTPPITNEPINTQSNVNATAVPSTSNEVAVEPVMPSPNVESNIEVSTTPNVNESSAITPPAPKEPEPNITSSPNTVVEPAPIKFDTNTFIQDKETFLKACENMFDALISKYQKQLDDLEKREQDLKAKEAEITQKLNAASEHLANAEAREEVANIAHDNAQKVMDINNLMPNNPITN